ncbi:MAG TPA: hypothetical protein PLO56_11000 [Rhodothermales bacterium]|nr:hypothetical protein [Rhodothermales bacterium]
MKHLLLLSLLLGLSGCPLIPNGGDPFLHYPYPQSITVNLEPSDGGRPVHAPVVLLGGIEVRTGTLREVAVFFESSEDLAVEAPAPAPLAQLVEGESRVWSIQINKGKGKADAGGTWVRLRVVYKPDYERLLALVSDEVQYPHAEIRETYRAATLRSMEAETLATNATRLFFE